MSAMVTWPGAVAPDAVSECESEKRTELLRENPADKPRLAHAQSNSRLSLLCKNSKASRLSRIVRARHTILSISQRFGELLENA